MTRLWTQLSRTSESRSSDSGSERMPLLSESELEAKLQEVVARMRETFSPVAIYLCGSYAYGTPNRHSDIDLLVVVEETPLDPRLSHP